MLKMKKVNQLISLFQEIMSSHELIIETEYTSNLSEDEDCNVKLFWIKSGRFYCEFI